MLGTDFLYITNSSLNILLHIKESGEERFHTSHVLFEFYLVSTDTNAMILL